ncbi:MAG: hypothetical protein AAFV53_19370 [Myxococcota bacterium]
MSRYALGLGLMMAGCRSPVTSIDLEESQLLGSDRAPKATVLSPRAGSWLDHSEFEVSGTIQSADPISMVTINEVPVLFTDQLEFSQVIALEPGINTITVAVETATGTRSEERVSVIAGPFRSTRWGTPEGGVVELNMRRLADVGSEVAGVIGFEDPVVEGEAVDTLERCVVVDGVVTGFASEIPTVRIEGGDGALDTQTIWRDVTVQIAGEADVCGEPQPFSLEVTAASLVAESAVGVALARDLDGNDRFFAEASVGAVSWVGEDVRSYDLREPLQVHGLNLEDIGVLEAIEASVRASLEGRLADAVGAAMTPLVPVDIGLVPPPSVSASWSIADTVIDEDGVVLSYNLSTSRQRRRMGYRLRHVVMNSPLQRDGTGAMNVSYSADAINHLLQGAWSKRALNGRRNIAPALDVYFRGRLPAMVHPTDAGLELRIGELRAQLADAERGTVDIFSISATAAVTPDLVWETPTVHITPLHDGEVIPELERAVAVFLEDALINMMPRPGVFVPGDEADGWVTAHLTD